MFVALSFCLSCSQSISNPEHPEARVDLSRHTALQHVSDLADNVLVVHLSHPMPSADTVHPTNAVAVGHHRWRRVSVYIMSSDDWSAFIA